MSIVFFKKIIQTLLVRQIWLFGSFAYGSPRKDSAYDIYVAIPDNTVRQIEAMPAD
ncbi:MAG: nucleotidyltransferase domain-containing protein [Spirochaetales bacterium]|nr:nucleotidyltransferase domain-containing protein [Spirochaetales bacterium]